MGETDLHRDMMINLIEALREYYRDQPQVYVSGNILFYYEEGEPRSHLSPDVLVALGVPQDRKETYKLWEVGKAPDLVIEVTSRTTRLRDVGTKKGLYEALGVREYVLFDPREEYLSPRFQVFRREGNHFLPALAPEGQGYLSPALGLSFRVVDGELRVFDPATGALLLTPAEHARSAKEQARRAEEQSRRAEEQSRRAEEQSRRAERYAARLRELGIDPESL